MFPIIWKVLDKNRITCLMTRDFDVLIVSGMKYRVTYNEMRLRFKNHQLGENIYEYLGFPISNSAFSSLNHHLSLFNYSLNKNLLIRNLLFHNSFKFDVWFASSNSSIFLPAHNFYHYGSWCKYKLQDIKIKINLKTGLKQ